MMRLIKDDGHGNLGPVEYHDDEIPRYAILSHTWGTDGEEVTLEDLMKGTGKDKTGYEKIEFCRKQAARDDLDHFWVDTCCIDKSSSAELSKAINSMFRWYQNADECYVYLSDVSTPRNAAVSESSDATWRASFRESRWFRRGWTLQELIAPASVEFFSREGVRIGSKKTLEQDIHKITGIAIQALRGRPLSEFTIEERMSWANHRETKHPEDKAYSLLGIFNVFMSLLYAEGEEKAFDRLRRKISKSMKSPAEQLEILPLPSSTVPFRRDPDVVDRRTLHDRGTRLEHIEQQGAVPLARLAPPQRHWIVPFGRNKDFIGRESILAELLKRIPPSVDEDDCQRTALEGLGGIGKTQIALEAAFRVRDEHEDCSVFWVPAVDAASFENAYREIGRQLKIMGIDEDKADVKSLVKATLGHERAGSWLLIVDNADDVELLFGNTETTALCDYLPFSRKGSILFTTRNHEAVVRLDIPERNVTIAAEMNRAEAAELLQRSLKGNQTGDAESTASLLDFLANLPLAIKQASTYMAKTGMSTTKYFDYCQSSNKNLIRLLSKAFQDRGRYKSIRNPIATTWLISFDHISRDNQLAANYLRFICFLAEKEIPLSLLPPVDDELEVAEAIGTLKAYAFVTEREESTSFDIHRLVRLAMQNWLYEEGEREVCITKVIQRLAEAFPFPQHENRNVWTRYLPHAQTALEFRDNSTDKEAEWRLLFNVADSYSILGKYQEAEQMHQQALELKERVLGKEHPDTLNSMNNLAKVIRRLGKYEEAEQMHRQTLEGYMRVLSKEHPRTLDSMNNLGLVLRRQGEYEEAEQMHRQALEGYKKVLGKEHPDTLDSMNNLAKVLRRQGKYEEAEHMHRQTLEGYMKVLGKEHPRTLDSINNLGLVLRRQGEYEEAEQMHRQALEGYKKMLGQDHPDTLDNMNNLGLVFDNQGKYVEAEQMHRQALELKEKVLGKEHPDTLDSMNNLALVLNNQRKYKEAEQMHRHTLKAKEKVLGKENPRTLMSMNNLGNVLRSLGKYEEAEQMHRQALESYKKVLGKEHPDTLNCVKNLANVLNDQRK